MSTIRNVVICATAILTTSGPLYAEESVVFNGDGSIQITIDGENTNHNMFGLSLFAGGGNFLTVYSSGQDYFYCGQNGDLSTSAVEALVGTTAESKFLVTSNCTVVRQEPLDIPSASVIAKADWEYVWGNDYVGLVQNDLSTRITSYTSGTFSVALKTEPDNVIFSCTTEEGSLMDTIFSYPSEQAFYQIGRDSLGICNGGVEISSTLLTSTSQ